jgi:menaquinone-dependent protoporphyrinogen IX oxidase
MVAKKKKKNAVKVIASGDIPDRQYRWFDAFIDIIFMTWVSETLGDKK